MVKHPLWSSLEIFASQKSFFSPHCCQNFAQRGIGRALSLIWWGCDLTMSSRDDVTIWPHINKANSNLNWGSWQDFHGGSEKHECRNSYVLLSEQTAAAKYKKITLTATCLSSLQFHIVWMPICQICQFQHFQQTQYLQICQGKVFLQVSNGFAM